ncbi:MAG: 50S ribosomal protein L13 [Bacilli bacterium]|nr:50S ribosomal protein L13 [Bacilli bacterium]
MKTTFMQRKEDVVRDWYIIDAKDIPLGRVASKAAVLLRGKHKATYTPHIDCGDNVIIINAKEVLLTGNKLTGKKYYNHSRYVGSLRERTAKEMKENYPEEMMERAIKGMLPKGRLGRQMYKKLHVYADANHPHTAQQPKEIEVGRK